VSRLSDVLALSAITGGTPQQADMINADLLAFVQSGKATQI
jgi:hypothetical protein